MDFFEHIDFSLAVIVSATVGHGKCPGKLAWDQWTSLEHNMLQVGGKYGQGNTWMMAILPPETWVVVEGHWADLWVMSRATIVIVGVGCGLPGGANNLEKLWELLSEKRNGQAEISNDHWNADSCFDAYPDPKQSMVTKHGYFLPDDISQFDAKFFGISSAEANPLSPPRLLFLITTYGAFKGAGIPVETLRGFKTGVYASTFERSYDRMGHKDLSTISRGHLNGRESLSRQ
ncbi:polyketide synthase [Fusarium sp. NRRL 52700]|nr:polyketide synthase [Fusarium sp. NRRL 52700]